jgi:hypothetical protein
LLNLESIRVSSWRWQIKMEFCAKQIMMPSALRD